MDTPMYASYWLKTLLRKCLPMPLPKLPKGSDGIGSLVAMPAMISPPIDFSPHGPVPVAAKTAKSPSLNFDHLHAKLLRNRALPFRGELWGHSCWWDVDAMAVGSTLSNCLPCALLSSKLGFWVEPVDGLRPSAGCDLLGVQPIVVDEHLQAGIDRPPVGQF